MGTSKLVNHEGLARRRHLRKVVRWTVGSALGLVTLGFVLFWIVSSSWFIIWRARPVLARQLGGPVEIGAAQYDGRGTFVLQDVRLAAPGLQGSARDVLSVGQIVVTTDLERLLTGRIRVEDLELSDVKLRLSEGAGGSFNFLALRPNPAAGAQPPRVRIYDALVEVGVHDGARYETVGRRLLSGSMAASSDDANLFNVSLHEIDAQRRTVPEGVSLQGQWNSRTFEHWATVKGLTLDRGTYDMCPAAVRFWWDKLDLQGRVGEAHMRMNPAEMSLSAELKIENVAMTLPVDGSGVWARYYSGTVEPTSGRPRMHVREGIVRIENTTLVMEDLQGELISTDGGESVAAVPYRVSLRLQAPGDLNDLAKLDAGEGKAWIEGVLETTAIDMTVVAEPFVLLDDSVGPVQTVAVPLPLARVLKRFNPTRCTLGTEIRVQRAAATRDGEGRPVVQPIRLSGHASIRDAQGAFFKFPYLLEDVRADLEFDNEQVRIVELAARGSEDATLRITGLVWPPGDDPAVQLRLEGKNVPLDDRLYAALPADSKQTFNALLDEQAFEARRAAGLITDADAIEAAKIERSAQLTKLNELSDRRARGEAVEQHELDRLMHRVARLERMIDAGPYEFGGQVDLDLKLDRPMGKGKRTVITGRIDALRVGLLHHQFRYPLQILSGRLDWRDDRIVIVADEHGDGMRVATPGGGMGMVTGAIRIEREGNDTRVLPELHVDVQGDQVNDLLYHAIPDLQVAAGQASPARRSDVTLSRGGELLQSLDLDAVVDYRGVIQNDEAGDPDFDFLLKLRDGSVDPSRAVGKLAGDGRLKWPKGMRLHDVQGELRVTPRRLDVLHLGGRRGEGRVDASGALDLRTAKLATPAELRFTQIRLEPALLELASSEDAASFATLWDRHQPKGIFDASIRFDPEATNAESPLVIVPHEFSCVLDGQAIALQRQAGLIRFDEQGFNLEGLQMRVVADAAQSAAAEPRDFELNGLVTIGQGLRADLAIRHHGGELSPQLRAILPEEVRRALDSIEFSCGQLDVLEDSHLTVRQQPGSSDEWRWENGFTGKIRVRDAEFTAGLRFSGVDALMEVVGHGGDSPTLEIGGRAGRVVVAGREMRDVDFALHLDETGQVVELSEFRGDLSGGAVSATARIGVADNRDYELDVSLVGVGLDGLATRTDSAIAAAPSGVPGAVAGAAPEATTPGAAPGAAPGAMSGSIEAPPTGRVYGRLLMAGARNDPAGRRGGGSVRIVDANIPVEPITMGLIQILDFMPPVAPSFNYLDAEFYINGDHATFEQLEVASPTLRLAGQGGMNVDSLMLDLRFRTRGSLFLISDVLTVLSDQIYEIAVSGPLNDPQARLIGLPALNPYGPALGPASGGEPASRGEHIATEPTD